MRLMASKLHCMARCMAIAGQLQGEVAALLHFLCGLAGHCMALHSRLIFFAGAHTHARACGGVPHRGAAPCNALQRGARVREHAIEIGRFVDRQAELRKGAAS